MRTETIDYIIENLQDKLNELMTKSYDRIKYDINMCNQRLIYLRRRYQQASNLEIDYEMDPQEYCYHLYDKTSNIIDYMKELHCLSKEVGDLWLKYRIKEKVDRITEELSENE